MLTLKRFVPLGQVLPSALIIGTQRGGTSSLYAYLARHPDAAASLRKEVGYFTMAYGSGTDWYRAHFPSAALNKIRQSCGLPALLAFEASPDYLFDPRAAARAAALLPEAKIVVLLRDPVARAWSHWSHNRRLGREHLSFPEALAAEPERVGQHFTRLATVDPLDRSIDEPLPLPLARFSYSNRGRYADQLGLWLKQFPRENIFVVRSEDFYADTARTFALILEFLGLTRWYPSEFPNVSHRKARAPGPRTSEPRPAELMDRKLRSQLAETFAAENERLYRIIGLDLRWDKASV